jgi:hypothetical protein
VIYDLLVKNSGPLELREDPDLGVCVAGLKRISVTSAAEIMVNSRSCHDIMPAGPNLALLCLLMPDVNRGWRAV